MKNEFQVIAHRGASSLCPENTKSAFLKALEIGVDWIETDLRLTRDGVWVIIHDRDISRHCGQKTKVEHLTLGELRRYEYSSWFSAFPSRFGYQIPNFSGFHYLADNHLFP